MCLLPANKAWRGWMMWKKKTVLNVADVDGSSNPTDLSPTSACALLCHYSHCQQRSPFFCHKTTTLWAFYFYYHYYYFHFTNIFTGVTEWCHNGHLKTTAAQRHTRRLNIKCLATEKKQRLNEAAQDSRCKLEASWGYLAGCFVVAPQRRRWWNRLSGVAHHCCVAHPTHPTAAAPAAALTVCWPCDAAPVSYELTGGYIYTTGC